jgi:alpha-L-fucosidase 2
MDGQMAWLSNDYHWNTDVQATYWPIYAANRLDFGMALYDLLDRCRPNMRELARSFFGREGEFLVHGTDPQCRPTYDWAKAQFEFNGGLWAAHHYWLHYLYSQDKEFLKRRALPFIKEVLRPVLEELEPDASGVLHLPLSFSPEYHDHRGRHWGPDGTFDLGLIRFALKSLLEGCEILGVTDTEQGVWRRILKMLASYPEHPRQGIMVRADAPYELPHRHPSHLAPLYPFHLLDWEKDRPLLEKTLRQWALMGTGEWVGWSFGWAATIASLVERPNLARSFLLDFTDRYISESTLHMQGPPAHAALATRTDFGFTMEAGFAAVDGLQHMLLQSHGGTIRVFPALPAQWQDAVFWSMRTEGAFLVSAVRQAGATRFIHVESTAGGSCRVRADMTGKLHVDGAESFSTPRPGELMFPTVPGGLYLIWSGEARPVPTMHPVAARSYELNYFGTKKPPRF